MKKRIAAMLLICLLLLCACSAEPSTGVDETGSAVPTDSAASQESGHTEGQDDNPGGLQLCYDDRYTFSEEITEIRTVEVTSVSVETGAADPAVLTLSEGSTVIATGTGSAEVLLSSGETVTVTVSPAQISLLFLFGQSNTEGMILSNNPQACAAARGQSVLCEEGQVYSTYAPYHIEHGSNIGGVSFTQALSVSNAADFVASSLTSDRNASGELLEYPLNQLSRADGGKSGMDSAIAYEWNRLTGEKVWVVNAAHCGSSISTWQPGEAETDNAFWQAVGVGKACQAVLTAEIEAGHYRFSRMGYFWLQGCADRTWSAQQYTDSFRAMHGGLTEQLSCDLNGDGTAETLSFAGIVLVRNPVTSLTPLDLQLNGPRTSQIYMGTTDDADFETVFLASTLGDLWISDRNVEEFYRRSYPDGELSFPVRQSYPIPATVSEVHPDIHYRQPGYNELGFDAVRNILELLSDTETQMEEVLVYHPDGYTVYGDQELLTLQTGGMQPIAALGAAGSLTAKGITIQSDCPGLTVFCNTLIAANDAAGATGTLRILLGDELVLTLQVKII